VNTAGTTPMAKVYPNPATTSLVVDISDNTFDDLHIYDMSGSLLGNYEVKGKQTSIPTGHLSPGTYLLQLSDGANKASVRFIKQ
jgi:hypothetical protein